ncbi:MAG: outer membrane protein assembly factor BamD [Nitrospinota bacterium]
MSYKKNFKIRVLLLQIVLASGLSLGSIGCETVPKNQPALYNLDKANNYYARSRFVIAADLYRKTLTATPKSKYRQDALLGLADSLYKSKEYFESSLNYIKFLTLYPLSNSSSHATFYLGMCQYFEAGDAERDQTSALKAINTFTTLLNKHGDSSFAPYAIKYRAELRKRYEAYLFTVANFYYRVDKNISAIGRFKDYIKNYPRSKRVPEAYYKIASSYYKESAYRKTAATLTMLIESYPDSKWSKKGIELSSLLKLQSY